jgi:hypothetical protein
VARIDELLERRKHADPLTDSRANDLSPDVRALLGSDEMLSFRSALMLDGSTDIRESLLEELHTYFTDDYLSIHNANGDGAGDRVASWAINLLWYAWRQAEGVAYPVQVEVARNARAGFAAGRHLDFGSGVGVTSQLFHSLGYSVELADIEVGLLEFAKFRLQRRGVSAAYLALVSEGLPRDHYDVATAIDSLMFVPQLPAAACKIRGAVRTNGLLFANFDTRRDASAGWDILYHDDLWLRRRLQEAGFEPERKLGYGVRRYRAVADRGISHTARRARDDLLFPLRRLCWAARGNGLVKKLRPSP